MKVFGYPYSPRRNEVRLAFKLLKPQAGDKILDIGCGDGIWTNELAKKGCKVVGIDISNHDLALARKRADSMSLKNIKYILTNAEKPKLPSASFDKIISISTFEHIKNESEVLKECYRLLRPGGILVISIPTGRLMTLPKILLKFPKSVKKLFFASNIATAKTSDQYYENINKKYHHFRNYNEQDIRQRLKSNKLIITNMFYHVKFLSLLPHNLIHSFKIFEWEKNKEGSYQFNSQIAHALAFLIFYPFYLLDDLIPLDTGLSLIVKARKG